MTPERIQRPSHLYTPPDIRSASESWGANCGPAALAAITREPLEAVRPHLCDFESKGYTNPTMMYAALTAMRLGWTHTEPDMPAFGLVRIQWEGPWTKPGVPMRARYRHTHWIGTCREAGGLTRWIFDVNCESVGGWIDADVWRTRVVPWLLRECEPKASGDWHVTHGLNVRRARG
jgi:hypothetical protein